MGLGRLLGRVDRGEQPVARQEDGHLDLARLRDHGEALPAIGGRHHQVEDARRRDRGPDIGIGSTLPICGSCPWAP